MDNKANAIVERIIELGEIGTPEALQEMRELIEMQTPGGPRVGTIVSGGNTTIARTIVINNGRRVERKDDAR